MTRPRQNNLLPYVMQTAPDRYRGKFNVAGRSYYTPFVATPDAAHAAAVRLRAEVSGKTTPAKASAPHRRYRGPLRQLVRAWDKRDYDKVLKAEPERSRYA